MFLGDVDSYRGSRPRHHDLNRVRQHCPMFADCLNVFYREQDYLSLPRPSENVLEHDCPIVIPTSVVQASILERTSNKKP